LKSTAFTLKCLAVVAIAFASETAFAAESLTEFCVGAQQGRAAGESEDESYRGLLRASRELDAGRPGEALALLETLVVGGFPPSVEPSLRALLARALDSLIADTGSDEGCQRIVGRVGSRLPELAWRARSAASLEAVAACSDRLGLERYAASLRAARARDFAAQETQAPERGAHEPGTLADGPARAAAAYASGDFEAAKAMPGAGAWALLSEAGETARRARILLAEPSRGLQ
jgi:hypothetical protein